MQWFRMYAEFATDPVVQSLAFDDQRHFVVILCLKCSGLLDRAYADIQMRAAMLRRVLGLEATAFDEAKNRLQAAGLIDANWQPRNWDKRQFLSDSSTDRVRQFRERHRNVSVTPSDTDPDTDSEAEKEKTRGVLPRGTALTQISGGEAWRDVEGIDASAFERWLPIAAERGKVLDGAGRLALAKWLAGRGVNQAAIVDQSVRGGWKNLRELEQPGKRSTSVADRVSWRPES